MAGFRSRYTANNADIGEMCGRIERFLAEQELGARETERLCLTMERLLRRIGERMGWGTPCELTLERRLGRARVLLRYPGDAFDPTLIGRESEGDGWSAQLLADLGLVPEWSWRRGVNRLTLRPRGKERSRLLLTLPALALGALLYLALRALPDGMAEAADAFLLAPLCGAFVAAAGLFARLAVFFSAATIVCGVGDTTALGRMGRLVPARGIGLTLLWTMLSAAGTTALLRPAFSPPVPGSLLRAAVPKDPFSPFAAGGAGQLVFLALVCGAALLSLGGRAGRAREWAEQCGALLAAVTRGLCRLLPGFVCLALTRALLTGGAAALLPLWKPLAASAVGLSILVAAKLLLVCLRLRVTPRRLLRALLPPVRAAFLSASGDAAFGRSLDACENDLGVSHELALNALPIGGVLCVPAAALCVPAVALALAAAQGQAADVTRLVLLVPLGAVLAMAVPRAPGPLWLTLLLLLPGPEDAAAAALLCVLLEPLAAAADTLYLPAELAVQADRLDLLGDALYE